MLVARIFAAIVAGYLLGSIPFGGLVGRLYKGVDIRRYGSGRTGATNVLRTLGPGAAACVVVGDLAKGACAVLAAKLLLEGGAVNALHIAEAGAGLAAIAGHNWSIFLQLSGGRGVLVAAGALLVLFPPAMVLCVAAGGVVIALSRFVSLGSLVGVVIAALAILTFVAIGQEPRPYAAFAIIGATVIILQHRDNIERLRAGTERKLGQHVPLPPTRGAV
ncbi:MAG: glycerol-3-phosphate 1-O-acyltransferase PlsY [Chloroflexota bacterium]